MWRDFREIKKLANHLHVKTWSVVLARQSPACRHEAPLSRSLLWRTSQLSNPLLLLAHPAAGGGACGNKNTMLMRYCHVHRDTAGCFTAAATTDWNPQCFIKWPCRWTVYRRRCNHPSHGNEHWALLRLYSLMNTVKSILLSGKVVYSA